jgi:hypothetical protein
MAELFRLKVSPEQRIELPARLTNRLRLKPGDEIEFLIGDDNRLSVSTVSAVTNNEPSEKVVEELEHRANRPAASQELVKKVLEKSKREAETITGARTRTAS